MLGLVATGLVSARLGGGEPRRAVARNVLMGALTMVVTYYTGVLFGVTVG